MQRLQSSSVQPPWPLAVYRGHHWTGSTRGRKYTRCWAGSSRQRTPARHLDPWAAAGDSGHPLIHRAMLAGWRAGSGYRYRDQRLLLTTLRRMARPRHDLPGTLNPPAIQASAHYTGWIHGSGDCSVRWAGSSLLRPRLQADVCGKALRPGQRQAPLLFLAATLSCTVIFYQVDHGSSMRISLLSLLTLATVAR